MHTKMTNNNEKREYGTGVILLVLKADECC